MMKQDGVIRPLLETERRVLRRAVLRSRHRLLLSRRRVFGFVAGVFVVGCGLTVVVSRHVPPIDVIIIWFLICATLGLWSYVSARRELTRDVDRFQEALRRDEAHEVRVQASEMVEFEEIEDEGACYAFQLSENRILFVSGQEYYPSARFPNTDFSLVDIYAQDGRCLEELICKRGRKLSPSRVVPAQIKSSLHLPSHLETT
jgi:hypothetical protein